MCGAILFVSATVNGNVHDKKVADTQYKIPASFELYQDTGYQGYKPEGVQVYQPTKKKKGQDLTDEQKQENKVISAVRIRVEHSIGGVKRCRIVKDECRLRKDNFIGKVFLTCSSIHNYRLSFRPFNYKDTQK